MRWDTSSLHLQLKFRSQGSGALPQPCGVTAPVTWAVFWGFTHPGASVQHKLWWESDLQDWAAQWFFFMWCDVSINMNYSPVLVHSWDMEFGPFMPIPSLAEREAQRGEVAQRRVLAPASSLARCHSGHVLLPAWTSDVSAAKWEHWVRGFPGTFVSALKCHVWLQLIRGQQGLYDTWWLLSKLREPLFVSFWIPGIRMVIRQSQEIIAFWS